MSATEIARRHTATAIAALVDVLHDADSKGSEVVAAANALLDRGHGKPTQAVITARLSERASDALFALDDAALLGAIRDFQKGARGAHPQNGTGDAAVENGRRDLTQALPTLTEGGGVVFDEGGGVISDEGGGAIFDEGGGLISAENVAANVAEIAARKPVRMSTFPKRLTTDVTRTSVHPPRTEFERILRDPLLG
jgi:hypothetical protein